MEKGEQENRSVIEGEYDQSSLHTHLKWKYHKKTFIQFLLVFINCIHERV